MRLTADLVLRSPSFVNTLKERELDLRGNRIPFIENLGATEDQYDTLDFSNNDISKLENFPLLKRLHTILLNTNKIVRIAENLQNSIPNLQTLILSNNRIESIGEIIKLSDFKKLTRLSLWDNPIQNISDYRLHVIHHLPNLKILDFTKITIKERRKAKKLLGAKNNKSNQPKTFVVGETLKGSNNNNNNNNENNENFTDEMETYVKNLIQQSEDLNDIQILDRVLTSKNINLLPDHLKTDDYSSQ
eukprot:TRINITY_DN311_c1_g1_i1.p1 TRINITY_DN311_c1_g1~~TRINITY_DN311_c1_g1_i1.p1  ORF type:complete len:246 (-),score=70.51 TRINITY_DN311_c1_g1_i1:98-835(-)